MSECLNVWKYSVHYISWGRGILNWRILGFLVYQVVILERGIKYWGELMGSVSIYSLYRFFDKVMSSLHFFMFHSFEFERNNLEYLEKLIHPEDRKDLTLDFRDATFRGITLSLPEGSPFYDWKIDNKSQLERQKAKHK
ncbi:hypothetical protein AVEN_118407-1 [Araneus ventricosus]|uniref:Fatty acyl-CoA reductase C-terminal domain-containing protein n=1 Tax=Araneus ventricosus TaxID=182803 RepID=A0A4Y2B583_ARAVE|nr:hypothetical protein AVEN_118407-1 [Araneus ventricosus]